MDDVGHRRFTWRVVVFVIALLSVAFVVIAAILFTANDSYFVDFNKDGQVVVYQGKPGGVLWMDPSVELTTDIERDDLPEDVRTAIDNQKEFGSESDVTVYLVNLKDIASEATSTTTTTTTTSTTSTTTTSPPTTTAPVATTTNP